MLSEEVVNYLMEQILTGRLQPGDRLPSERNLADSLGVSRTVVREAIKVLSEKGLLAVRVGKGAYVTSPSSRSITESIKLIFHLERGTVENVIEIRKFLEIPLAGIAAQRATPQNLAEMHNLMSRMAELIGDESAYIHYIQIDLEFHLAIARATQNPLFILLIKPVIDLMQKTRLIITRAPNSYERSHFHHNAIYTAIASGDEVAARAAMAAHLEQVQEDAALMLSLKDEIYRVSEEHAFYGGQL